VPRQAIKAHTAGSSLPACQLAPTPILPALPWTLQIDMADMRMRPWPGRTHRFLQVPPLYPFGHGLSYTTFQYTKLAISPSGQGRGMASPSSGDIKVSVQLRNAGSMAADEVVLLLLACKGMSQEAEGAGGVAGSRSVRMPCATPPALEGWRGHADRPRVPQRTLAAFERVSLGAGEARSIHMSLSAAQFAAAASGALSSIPASDEAAGVACGSYELRLGSIATVVALVGQEAGSLLEA
jgi:hypothetical protein